MRKRPEELKTITAALPKKLLEAAEKYMAEHPEIYRGNRTHLIEQALSEKIKSKPSK